jgi:hypothetical protein
VPVVLRLREVLRDRARESFKQLHIQQEMLLQMGELHRRVVLVATEERAPEHLLVLLRQDPTVVSAEPEQLHMPEALSAPAQTQSLVHTHRERSSPPHPWEQTVEQRGLRVVMHRVVLPVQAPPEPPAAPAEPEPLLTPVDWWDSTHQRQYPIHILNRVQ